MAKKIINIRLEDSVWQKAKVAAASDGITLQEWLTLAILSKLPHKIPVGESVGKEN